MGRGFDTRWIISPSKADSRTYPFLKWGLRVTFGRVGSTKDSEDIYIVTSGSTGPGPSTEGDGAGQTGEVRRRQTEPVS